MIKSMTGYGKGEATCSSKKITVEVRTLNSKQLDMSLRLPSLYRQVEVDIRSLINKGVQRGKCEVHVSYNSIGGSEESGKKINAELFANYLKQIKDVCSQSELELPSSCYGDLVSSILRMPDVVAVAEEELDPQECQTVIDATVAAISGLNEFREQEGAILIADILSRVDKIEAYMNEVTPFEQQRVEVVKKRILEGLETLKVPIDSNRLEQEMIFYIEKLDITEEKTRLTNHCNYFRQVSNEEEGVGRKLGFISQEMGREINTMGSKANNANIQKLVVKMKDELEKIKEQLLNIL